MEVKTKAIHPAELAQNFSPNELSGLKVTFINMPLRESAKPNTPPEGPGILAAVLRNYGADCRIIDLNGYRIKEDNTLANGRHLTLEETEKLINAHLGKYGDQDIIAFSGMITTLRWQENVAKIVRKLQPDTFLVSGGGLATQLKKGLFHWIPELNAVAHSEGDDVILVIGKDVHNIKKFGMSTCIDRNLLGPYFIGNYLGKDRFVYAGNRPKNLDLLPFAAWDLLESDPFGYNLLEEYISVPVWGGSANNSSATSFTMKRSLTTVSSRGCPYSCAFCYRGAQGERNYGMRSAEHLARQVKEYVDKYNVDFVGFPDDNFAISKKRIQDLPRVFKEHGLNIRWGTHTRLDEADERVYPMAESGCVYIGFGAESASAPILERMKKGGFILVRGITKHKVDSVEYEFPTTMFNGIKNCKDVGIHANCTWIMGYPGETLSDLKVSVAFIKWQLEEMTRGLNRDSIEYARAHQAVNQNMFTATAYPGTAMFKDPECRQQLAEHFKLTFDPLTGEPAIDEHYHKYVLELDDATKVLHNSNGEPLNFSKMNMDTFLQAREFINNKQLFNILEM